MRQIWIAVFLAGAVALAGAQNKKSSNPQNASNLPGTAAVHASGFDLAPGAASPNQIGGASHGVNQSAPVVLYVPHKGMSYTLRPSFWWKGNPNITYKFHLQNLQGGHSWEREVDGGSMAYPASAPPLKPGHTYIWSVESNSSFFGPPPSHALIVVLPKPERAKIKAALAKIYGSSEQAGIERAKIFYKHRLWYDTLMAYNKLIAKYPNSEKLLKLRDELYEQLPVTRTLAAQDISDSK